MQANNQPTNQTPYREDKSLCSAAGATKKKRIPIGRRQYVALRCYDALRVCTEKIMASLKYEGPLDRSSRDK